MTAAEFTRIPIERLDDIPSMESELTRRILLTKEQLYKDVIREAVNREPTSEDFKEVTIANHPNYPTQELIAYKDHPLGRITLAFENGWEGSRIVFTFEPIPTFKNNGTI